MNYLFSRCDDKAGSLDQFPVRLGHIYTKPESEPSIHSQGEIYWQVSQLSEFKIFSDA